MSSEAAIIEVEAETARILEEMKDAKTVDRSTLSAAEARAQMAETSKVWNDPMPHLAEARDVAIDGPDGPITLRLLRPDDVETDGAILFFHGGGFVLGSIETHHRMMRLLAIESRSVLIGVDYRLAPEHPFPSGLEDCVHAARWLQAEATSLGIDPERIVLAGDSAGANLALATLLKLRDGGHPLPSGAALFYGCYWARLGTDSHQKYGGGAYRLSTDEMGWFWQHYFGTAGRGDVYAEPMDAHFAGLPPLFLNYGEVDPLADDTRELALRLDRAGVVHECVAYPGLVHGFLQMTSRVKPAAEAMTRAGRAIQDMLR
ncbi:MAG: alpha/beta hydrolase [Alphaproteobacteria bacterium]